MNDNLVFDASALIALMKTSDVHHSWAYQVFINSLEMNLRISALTYAETLITPVSIGTVEKFQRDLAGLGLSIEAIDADSVLELAKIRLEKKLKMPDAAVLQLTAKLQGVLATGDMRLAQAARQLGLRVFTPGNEA